MKKITNTSGKILDPIVCKLEGEHQVDRICFEPNEVKELPDWVADYIVEHYEGLEYVKEEVNEEINEEEKEDFSGLKKEELIALCEERGIGLTGNEKKADLVELLSK